MPVCDLAISKRANAGVAQWKRQRTQNPYSASSNLAPGTERISGIRSEQNRLPLRGFGTVAQLVERPPEERKVFGSNPNLATMHPTTRCCAYSSGVHSIVPVTLA